MRALPCGPRVNGDTAVVVAGRRRGIKPTIKLARIHLKGALGDTIHALLCGAYSPGSSQPANSPLNRPRIDFFVAD